MSSSGLSVPDGDPGGIGSAASALEAGAAALDTVVARIGGAATSVLADWDGAASDAFEKAASTVHSGIGALAGHHGDAAAALSAYAAALAAAQAAARLAIGGYEEAQRDCASTISQITATGQTADQAEQEATGTLRAAWSTASALSDGASADAARAANACATALDDIANAIGSLTLHQFVDILSWPGAALGAPGLIPEAAGFGAWLRTARAMATNDWDYLATLNPEAYATMMSTADQFGTGSLEALAAQYRYEGLVAGDSFTDAARAAVPLGPVTGVMDVVGKASLGLGAVTDVLTIADPQSSGLDRGMAAVNLVGTGMAASTLILGANAVADWIPVVGEAVMIGTALYFTGTFVAQNWSTICHWTDDVGGALATGYDATTHAVGTAVSATEHAVGSAVSTGEHVAGDVTHTVGEGVDTALHGAESAGSTLVKGAGQLLSDLNPF